MGAVHQILTLLTLSCLYFIRGPFNVCLPPLPCHHGAGICIAHHKHASPPLAEKQMKHSALAMLVGSMGKSCVSWVILTCMGTRRSEGCQGPGVADCSQQEEAADVADGVGAEVGQATGALQQAAHQLSLRRVRASTTDQSQCSWTAIRHLRLHIHDQVN